MSHNEKYKLMIVAAGLFQSQLLLAGPLAFSKVNLGLTKLVSAESRALSQNRFWVADNMPAGSKAFMMMKDEGRILRLSDINTPSSTLNDFSFSVPPASVQGDVINSIKANPASINTMDKVLVERKISTGVKANETWGINETLNEFPVAYKTRDEFFVTVPGVPSRPNVFVNRGPNAARSLSITKLKVTPGQPAAAEQLVFNLGKEIEGSIASWNFDPLKNRLSVYVVEKNTSEVAHYQYRIVAKGDVNPAQENALRTIASHNSKDASVDKVEQLEAQKIGETERMSMGAAKKRGIFAEKTVYKDTDLRPELASELPAVSHAPRPVVSADQGAH